MYKYRGTYWSNSKLAKWIHKKIGCPKPRAATMEEWDEWENNTHDSHPIVYFIVERGFDFVQDVINYPLDIWNAIRTYLRHRFVYQTHVLRTSLKKGEYHETNTRLMHGLFGLLVDFVEIEKCALLHFCHSDLKRPWWNRIPALRWGEYRSREKGLEYLKWEMDLIEDNHFTEQALTAQEVYELYIWWKDIRPNRPDPYEASGWTAWCEKMRDGQSPRSIFGKDPNPKKTRKILDELQRIEREYDEEDEQNLIRLVRLRRSLWT